jgi:hypothetical protein
VRQISITFPFLVSSCNSPHQIEISGIKHAKRSESNNFDSIACWIHLLSWFHKRYQIEQMASLGWETNEGRICIAVCLPLGYYCHQSASSLLFYGGVVAANFFLIRKPTDFPIPNRFINENNFRRTLLFHVYQKLLNPFCRARKCWKYFWQISLVKSKFSNLIVTKSGTTIFSGCPGVVGSAEQGRKTRRDGDVKCYWSRVN